MEERVTGAVRDPKPVTRQDELVGLTDGIVATEYVHPERLNLHARLSEHLRVRAVPRHLTIA
jgi:hypothetical protein